MNRNKKPKGIDKFFDKAKANLADKLEQNEKF